MAALICIKRLTFRILRKKTAARFPGRRFILFSEGSSKNKTAAIAGGRFGVGSITLRNHHRDEEYSPLAGLAATYSSKS
jgi:hypothetical protein